MSDLTDQQVGTAGNFYDDALRIDYQPVLQKQFSEETILLKQLKRGVADKVSTSGSYARITLQKALHPAVGARKEGIALPTKSHTPLETADVYTKYNYARIGVTGPVMKASRDNAGALMDALDMEMQSATTGMLNDINRQLACGNGVGVLALDNGGSHTTTWELDSQLGIGFTTPASQYDESSPVKYFVADMAVDVGDSTTYTTIDVSGATVTTVNSVTQITGTTITGADDNGYFFKTKATDAEMMGLRGAIDDGGHLDTYETIQRTGSGNGYWKASVVDKGSAASPATLVESYMQSAWTLSERNGGKTGLILAPFSVRDTYASILSADKRYMSTTLEGGFEALSFNGKPLVPDKDCTPFTMYFIDLNTLALFEESAVEWADKDGAVLSRVSGYDDYEAFLVYYANLGSYNCVKNACLSYVQ